MIALLGFLGPIFQFVLKLLGAKQPLAVQEGEKAGSAQTVVQIQEQSNEAVQKASAARDVVAAADDRPSGLQQAIEADPDCRDR